MRPTLSTPPTCWKVSSLRGSRFFGISTPIRRSGRTPAEPYPPNGKTKAKRKEPYRLLSPVSITRKQKRHDPIAVRDVRLHARDHHAEGITLPPLSVVPNQPRLSEASTAAGGSVRRLSEERTDRGSC